MKEGIPHDVQRVFDTHDRDIRKKLLAVRRMILDVAAETAGVGELEETLKWGQISYLTPKSKSGTTIRIDGPDEGASDLRLYVHCQTSLVDTMRSMYGDLLEYEGTRCIRYDARDAKQTEAVRHFIWMALTYHQG